MRDCGTPRIGFCRALPTTLRKQRYAVRLRAEGLKKQPTMRKYKLTSETISVVCNGAEITLHRIQALRDFGDIKAGDLGGFIEKESNLSQDGNCWVYDTAKVYGDAKIFGNALVDDNAKVFGYAEVHGCAKVSNNAEVYGNTDVYGNAKIYGNAEVSGSSKVCGDTMLST